MYHLDNGQKLQTPSQACRENDTAWQFIKILANVPLSTRELRSRPPKKVDFVIFLLSHTKLLTSIAYKLKQLLYLLHIRSSCANVFYHSLPMIWLHSSCLLNPCQSDILWFATTRRNSYQPVLVCLP